MKRKDILDRKNEILKWIKEKKSKVFICKELNCNYNTLSFWLKQFNIHYKGTPNWAKNRKFQDKLKPATDYTKNGTTISSQKLKLKLFRDNIKEKKCEICGITKWNGLDAPLELHHIDGNKYNNELINIQILCPNCHSQTSNFVKAKKSRKNKYYCSCGKEIKKSSKCCPICYQNERRKKEKKRYYCECGKEINRLSKTCEKCCQIKGRKIKNRPSLEILLEEVNNNSYVQIGKKYGVTDNCIRKWLRYYGIDPPKKFKKCRRGVNWQPQRAQTPPFVKRT